MVVTYTTQRLKLGKRVDGAKLRRLRYVEHAWGYHMLVGLVCIEVDDISLDILGTHLAIDMWQCEDFMSRSLDSSRLMDGDMSALGSEDTLMVAQDAIDGHSIGLRASHKEEDLSIGHSYSVANKTLSLSRIGIVAIAPYSSLVAPP